jgi:cytochrome c peroxidase
MLSPRRCLAAAIALVAALPAFANDALRESAAKLFGRLEPAPASAVAGKEAALGRLLFWDERLSADGKTACASCHRDHGADRRPASIDAKGNPTGRHSPTVFNALAQPAGLRWLADRRDAVMLAEGLISGPLGFASKQAGVDRLAEVGYGEAFRSAYPDEPHPLNATNYGRALAAYQATLVTPAPFDRWLAGDDRALDRRQKNGLKAFIETGCAGCHDGALFGGRSMAKFGATADYWIETGSAKRDPGRFAMTTKEEDRNVFRVPMLRNVARTAPYFHDGSVDSLDRAVRIMGKLQLGRTLDEATVAAIVAFLESLSGEAPAHFSPPSRP